MVEYSIVIYFALYSLALISIGVVLHIILSRDKKNANKPLPTKQAKVMEHKECFDFYYNTMKTKFKFWFTSELLPKYITNKGDEISRAMVIKIEKKFVADVLKSLHRNILTRLLEEYYSDKDSLIRATKEFFYNQISEMDLKYMKENSTDQSKVYGAPGIAQHMPEQTKDK